MPVELVVLTARAPVPADWLDALRQVDPGGWIDVLPGAAAQLHAAGDVLLCTVAAPRHVAVPSEGLRLLGEPAGPRPWWTFVAASARTDAVAAVVSRVASACDGVVR